MQLLFPIDLDVLWVLIIHNSVEILNNQLVEILGIF